MVGDQVVDRDIVVLPADLLVLDLDVREELCDLVLKLEQPLAPAKNIGNRATNLYPKPWRIKSTHLPSAPVEIINV